jgi:hypothetical protein
MPLASMGLYDGSGLRSPKRGVKYIRAGHQDPIAGHFDQ